MRKKYLFTIAALTLLLAINSFGLGVDLPLPLNDLPYEH